jgi:hypothetical protein
MAKALLMSMLFMTIALPMRYSKDAIPARGHRKMLRAMAIFTAVWGIAIATIYFRLIYG